jgi:hypothetical protein
MRRIRVTQMTGTFPVERPGASHTTHLCARRVPPTDRESGVPTPHSGPNGKDYCPSMIWSEAALWGLFGSFAVEGHDLYAAVRRRGCWPWQMCGPREVGAAGYFVAELVRLVIGSGLAGAFAESRQVTTAVGAVIVGIAAPVIVERLIRAIPLTDSVHDTAAVTANEWLPTASGSELNGQRPPIEEQLACVDEAEKVAPRGDHAYRVGE